MTQLIGVDYLEASNKPSSGMFCFAALRTQNMPLLGALVHNSMRDIYATPKADLETEPKGYIVVPERIYSYRNWAIYHAAQIIASVVLIFVSLWFVLLSVPLFIYSAFRLPTYMLSYKASIRLLKHGGGTCVVDAVLTSRARGAKRGAASARHVRLPCTQR